MNSFFSIQKKINYIQIIKIAIGSCLSILIADFLHLNYSASAGVITLLTIQNTKKETLLITLKRSFSFLISVVIAYIVFGLTGYHPFSYGLYLLLFIGICYMLSLEVGISMNAVLATHFLIEKSMSLPWIFNELFIFLLGSGIGILLNLYIPKKITVIREIQMGIEEKIREILCEMASSLLNPLEGPISQENLILLNNSLKDGLSSAYENMNNTLLGDMGYYIEYMQMRKEQYKILQRIHTLIKNLDTVPVQAIPIADYMNYIESTLHEYNNAIQLLDGLQEILGDFKSHPLPVSRTEFENRAILFQIIHELEAFLICKRDFVAGLTPDQKRIFWNQNI